MAEREHLDPSQEALQKQKKKGRAVWLGLAVAAAVVVLAAVGVCAAAHGSQRIFSGTEVLGVELGGLTREQAQERWLERGDARRAGCLRPRGGRGRGRVGQLPQRQFLPRRLAPCAQLGGKDIRRAAPDGG